MDEKVLRKLEYNKIIESLVRQCSCQLGKELAGELKPSYILPEIRLKLAETSEAKEVLRLFPNFSLGAIRDIRAALSRAKIGGIIEAVEFLQIYDTVGVGKKIKSFFGGEGKKYSLLAEHAAGIVILGELEQKIKKTITPDAEVSDTASEELARIRKQLQRLQGKARDKLEALVRSSEMQKYLQDPIITIRNERYVVPVKQEYRQYVPGIVHDQSASGASLFIEPMAVVEINNETQRYEAMERAEVIRILRQLTMLVQNHHEELEYTLVALGQLDFIFAKGKLSVEQDCGQPQINDKGYLKIIQGRHPLIQGKVVPITIDLGGDFETLVITGPNTGGKTVTLKTVGLFTLMAQAGLHVPAQYGTELAVFEQVFADIGDEQSIEQSLSTFSSHMTNIINILEKLDDRSLVLLDELGAGTDPTEGAALAMAILDHLIQVGARTIATTHYSELKSFAFNNDRVENASVEFDVETLQPTYRLLIGVPGKSNAFEISRRLGLSGEIVNKAKGLLSQEEIRVSDLIENLETNQLLSEKDRQEADKLKKIAQQKLSQLDRKEQELQEKAQVLLQKAQNEALDIVSKARRESEVVLKEIREKFKNVPQTAQQELQELRHKLQANEEKLRDEIYRNTDDESMKLLDLEPGDLVLIKRLNQKAQVLERPNHDEEVLVQAGIMKLTVKLADLKRLADDKAEKRRDKTGVGEIVSDKARQIKNELDLRGLTVDEAVLEVEKYLDDAYLAGLPMAYLIHGKGTGALRSAVGDLVKTHRYVKSSRMGGYNEGGQGVTVVEMLK